MPEIFEPSPNSARRPVLGTSALNANRRRRRKFPIAAMDVASVDDLEFTLQNSPVHLSHSNTTTTRKVHAKATTGNRTPLSHFLPPFARSTPISLPSITPQRNLVQQSLPSTPSTRKATLSHVRRALLIDTRTLDTNQGRAIGNSFASQTRSFLASLRRRGMVPNLLISLETSSIHSDRNRPPMITKTLRPLVDSHVSMDGMCEPMLVKHAVRSHNHTNKGQAIMIPTRFLANASWTVFGDLVEEAIRQDQTSPPSARKVPLSMTLLTNNVSLLCDDDVDGAHKAAMASFWNRIKPFFHKNIIRSMELEIVRVGSVVFTQAEIIGVESLQKSDASPMKNGEPSCSDVGSGMDVDTPLEQELASPKGTDAMTEVKESNAENDSTHVTRCVKQIQHSLGELADADSKANMTREVRAAPVAISVLSMENTSRDFGILARRWLSQIMSPPNLEGSFVFELPETTDGTQCSIALDARYRALPYPADSPAAAGMLADLQWISSCTMEAVQLVPISCVDANLLFGVSMVVTPAFQNDVNRFKEMKALAYVLFQELRNKDVALLLQAKGPDECSKSNFGPPRHHASHQTFLLMPQDVTPQVTGVEASLFRYVNADQLLSVGSIELYTYSVDDQLEAITGYVESALEMLPNNLINPLVNDEVRILRDIERMVISDSMANPAPAKGIDVDGEKAWTDTSGVGSLVQPEVVGPAVTTSTTDSDEEAFSGVAVKMSDSKELAGNSSDGVDEVMSPPEVNAESRNKAKLDPCTEALQSKQDEKVERNINRRKQKTKRALPSRSPMKEQFQLPPRSIKPSPEATDDISEVAPATVSSLMRRQVLGPSRKSTSKSACDNVIGLQESEDEISEFPATPKEQNTLDQLTATQEQALGRLLLEEDSDDDGWKGYAGVEFCNKSSVNPPASAKSKHGTTESSSDDEDLLRPAKRQSFQKAAFVFLEKLTDTDSDPEFS